MNDDFLKALRRDPSPQFARRLKQQLQAQDAQTKRRAWSLRSRALSFLIVGSAFAGGMLVLERRASEGSDAPQAQSQAQLPAIKPGSAAYRPRSLGPGFVPEGNGAASTGLHDSQPSADAPANIHLSGQSQPATPSASSAAPVTSGQTSSGGLIRARAAHPSVAISPLADALVRSVLSRQTSSARSETPRIETLAAEAAFAGLCAPGNDRRFDMVVTSRRISHAEFMNCRDNGVSKIIESKLGYQALVLTSARDSAPLKLSASDLYLAVAKQIPDPADLTLLIDNTNFTWDQVNSRFSYRPIAVFGPMRETPLRLLFETLLLEPGCNAQRAIEALRVTEPYRHAQLCRSLRDDRLYAEVEQTANLIPQYLWSDPHAFVLVDYRFYRDNQSQLGGSALEGPEPSYATFADGTYPLARPIYLYADQTLMERASDVYDNLQNLQYFGLWGPNRYGFVRLDDSESSGYQSWRRKSPLSVSDLTPPRSAPR
jgi:phosphate transport system substrate-binding protein